MWTDILKRRGKTSIIIKRLIDKIMSDGKGRNIQEIIDACFEHVKLHNETQPRQEGFRTGKQSIPTSGQVRMHLLNGGYKRKVEKRRHPLALPNDTSTSNITIWYKE